MTSRKEESIRMKPKHVVLWFMLMFMKHLQKCKMEGKPVVQTFMFIYTLTVTDFVYVCNALVTFCIRVSPYKYYKYITTNVTIYRAVNANLKKHIFFH